MLLAIGVLASRLDAFVIGAVLTVIGAIAKPLESLVIGRNGVSVTWMQQTVVAVQRRLEERRVEDAITISESVEATVTGAVHSPRML